MKNVSIQTSMKINRTLITATRRPALFPFSRKPQQTSIPRSSRQFSAFPTQNSTRSSQRIASSRECLEVASCSPKAKGTERAVLPFQSRCFSSSRRAEAGSMESHEQMVADISSTVRSFYDRKEPFRIFHGSTNSTRQMQKRKVVDTSRLNRVLKVDVAAKTALVEPNVPMDRLVEETMKYGLVPPVVMEFPGITVGGGYSGTSGESSSFKHGFFNRTINFVEMVLANGDVVKASDTEHPDLFHGAAGAVGSFGVTTLVELQLLDATKFVETTYHPVSSMAEAIEVLKEKTADPELDYVDGIIFSKTQGAVITGRTTNTPKPNAVIQRFSAARDPWFYLHVQDTINKTYTPTTFAIPLAEYLFRYDRGGFWVGASAFTYFMMPFNAFTRWFLDDFLHTRMMYTALHASGQSKKYIVQDLALPYDTAEEFVNYTDTAFGIYPLWLCPLKQSPQPTMHPYHPALESDGQTLQPLLNIGLWGFGPPARDVFIAKERELERKLRELGGMKWLYAQTYYSEDEFWSLYDRRWYDGLREKYGATTLPSVYEKVRVDVEAEKRAGAVKTSVWSALMRVWPLSGLWGIKKAIESRAYVEARRAAWKDFGRVGEGSGK